MTPFVLLEQEDWFESEMEFVRRLLLPGMHVIDVGANYGAYALTAAACVGEHGRVTAFEPASATAAYLDRSIAENAFTNVRIVRCALSDRNGEATLSLCENAELNTLQGTADTAGEVVCLRTLDDCRGEFDAASIDFLKLDAEGEEARVIRGGRTLLETTSPLVMFELKHGNQANTGLLQEMNQIGYQIYALIPGLNMLAPLDPAAALDPFQPNLFAAKDDCARNLEQRGLLAGPGEIDLCQVQSQDDLWYVHLEALTYAKHFLARWNRRRGSGSGVWRTRLGSQTYAKRALQWWTELRGGVDPDWLTYRHALNDYASAFLPQTPAAYRPAFLARSLATLSRLLDGKPAAFSRLSTWARVARDAGKRRLAAKIVHSMIEAFDSGQLEFVVNEPFFSATSRFDALDPGYDPADWCVASVLEAASLLSHYSSYFSGSVTLGYLERLAQGGYQSQEMERRRQLVRIRAGLQQDLEPRPILKMRSRENLNPEHWARGWLWAALENQILTPHTSVATSADTRSV